MASLKKFIMQVSLIDIGTSKGIRIQAKIPNINR